AGGAVDLHDGEALGVVRHALGRSHRPLGVPRGLVRQRTIGPRSGAHEDAAVSRWYGKGTWRGTAGRGGLAVIRHYAPRPSAGASSRCPTLAPDPASDLGVRARDRRVRR